MERESCIASNFHTFPAKGTHHWGWGSCPGQPLHAYLVAHTNFLVVPGAWATNLTNTVDVALAHPFSLDALRKAS